MATFKVSSVKKLTDNPNLTCIPPSYAFQTTSPSERSICGQDDGRGGEEPIPVIDYSLMLSGTPEQRSKAIQDLGYACQEWGFFMVINHGVDEDLMKRMQDKCGEFFHLTEEEKMEYEGKHVLDPIRCGTSFNSSVEEIFFWRDYLKVRVHPEFHSPNKPADFSKVLEEYTRAVRGVVRGLLGGISESLGLESCYIERALDIDSGLQILTANLYPPCPQPELAMGMPPHSDHGLLTMLIQNGICGLQIQHQGKWVSVEAIPNAFLVNTGDHMEILSNGKYRSVLHRAIVNRKTTRMSISISNGPSSEAVVSPAQELLDNGSSPAAYIGMKYKDYLELQQSNKLDGKSCLDRVKEFGFLAQANGNLKDPPKSYMPGKCEWVARMSKHPVSLPVDNFEHWNSMTEYVRFNRVTPVNRMLCGQILEIYVSRRPNYFHATKSSATLYYILHHE